jgi:hypothetical protein
LLPSLPWLTQENDNHDLKHDNERRGTQAYLTIDSCLLDNRGLTDKARLFRV